MSIFMDKTNQQSTTQDTRHDYERLARRANLRYVSDEEPGYTRRRWGRGFTYRDATGQTVKDKALRQRFDALVIPPMWSEVWICQHPDGHLQSTGAKIGKNCIIGAKALVTEGKEIPDNSLVMGAPAKVVKTLGDEQAAMLTMSAVHYAERCQKFKTGLQAIEMPE